MNQLQPQNRVKFSLAIQTEKYRNLINSTLGDPNRARRFIASISSAVATNPALQDCDAGSILSGALLGEALNLSPSPQLGQYYLVPFNDKTKGKVATFQLGWKGYFQLALRSGRYKKLNVLEVKQGELVKWDPLEEEIEINIIEDDSVREKTPTTGYYAFYENLDGFRKSIYWSKEKMEAHAMQYSMGYRAKKGYTFWEKNFDEMAKKTMLRQLISKYCVMSIDMQEAFTKDMAILQENGNYEYVDDVSAEVENIEVETTVIETTSQDHEKVVTFDELHNNQ